MNHSLFLLLISRDDDDANSLRISKAALDNVIDIGRRKYGLGSGPQVESLAGRQ